MSKEQKQTPFTTRRHAQGGGVFVSWRGGQQVMTHVVTGINADRDAVVMRLHCGQEGEAVTLGMDIYVAENTIAALQRAVAIAKAETAPGVFHA